jgi:Zn-dependent metalloprotease
MIKFPLISFSQKHRYLVLLLPAVFLLIGIPLLWAQKTTPQDPLFRYVEQRLEDNKTLYHLEKGNGMSAQQFLDRYGKMLGLGVNDSLHLYKEDSSYVELPDDYDYGYNYQQYYKGIKVDNGGVRINMKRGEVAMVAANVVIGLNIDINNCISETEALDVALEDTKKRLNKVINTNSIWYKSFPPKVTKIIYNNYKNGLFDPSGGYSLCYIVGFFAQNDPRIVALNARTKNVIYNNSEILNQCPVTSLTTNSNIQSTPKCLTNCFTASNGNASQVDSDCLPFSTFTGVSCSPTILTNVTVPTLYYGCQTIKVKSCDTNTGFQIDNNLSNAFLPIQMRYGFNPAATGLDNPDPAAYPSVFFGSGNNFIFTDKINYVLYDLPSTYYNSLKNQELTAVSAYWSLNIAYQLFKSNNVIPFTPTNPLKVRVNSTMFNGPGWNPNESGLSFETNTLEIPAEYSAATNPGASIDIMGHEFSHAIMREHYGITGTANSIETRALHEGLADVFGILTEKHANEAGFSNDLFDYDFGEDSKQLPTRFANCAQSSRIPVPPNNTEYRPQTDTYGSAFWNNASNYGGAEAYIKAGVIAYWFYLLSYEDTSPIEGYNELGNYYRVTNIELANARNLVLRTLKVLKDDGYNTPSFFHFKAASMKAAKQLFGECHQHVRNVAHAWYAVGMSQTDLFPGDNEELVCRCDNNGGAYPSDANYISRVKISNLDKTSGENNGYADFTVTGNTTCSLLRGNCINPVLISNFTPTSFQKAYWTIWVDLDKDGAFDDRERIYSRVFSTAYGYSLSLPIALPSDLPLGTTVMRVAVRKGSPLPVNGCELFDNGEIEDYRVNIAAGGYCGSSNKNELAGVDPNAELQVFPNPASQACFLNYIGTPPSHSYLTVDLYQLDGTLADSQQIPLDNYGNVTQSIDLSRLSNGLYMVRVSDGWQNWSQKLQVIQ